MNEKKKELNEKELNEAELDKVNGGVILHATRASRGTNPPCRGSNICAGSICPAYDSCTKGIKK